MVRIRVRDKDRATVGMVFRVMVQFHISIHWRDMAGNISTNWYVVLTGTHGGSKLPGGKLTWLH